MGNRLPYGLGGRGHWLAMLGGDKGEVNAWQNVGSDQFNHNRHIEFRVVLLDVLCPVLLPKFLSHRLHSLGIGQGSRRTTACPSPERATGRASRPQQ